MCKNRRINSLCVIWVNESINSLGSLDSLTLVPCLAEVIGVGNCAACACVDDPVLAIFKLCY